MIALKLFVALIAFATAAFVVWTSRRYTTNARTGQKSLEGFSIPHIIGALLLIIGTLTVLLPSFGQVSAGYRGVVLNFGKVTGQVLDEGLYFVTPFFNSVELMDVQVHADAAKASAASRDLQSIAAEVTVTYRLDPKRVATTYQELKHNYFERVAAPAIQEAVKAVTARYDAEKLVSERPAVRDAIEASLIQRFNQHGMIVDGVSITDLDFSPAFNAAIEAKQVAVQEALTAGNVLQKVKAEAEQKIATAKADAEAIRIQAQAVNAQGGEDYVRLQWIAKWDGALPYWVTGNSGSMSMVNMGSPPQPKQ